MKFNCFKFLAALLLLSHFAYGQCPTASGDQISYGNASWIGYVYDGADNFVTNYQGTITEAEFFDESFCGNTCDFTATSGCAVNTETFSVRFKMRQTYACGTYQFTIGGDDGVRLSIDGGTTYLINSLYSNHPYQTASASVFLDGTYDLVLDYYENNTLNRVSFSSALVVPAMGGTISGAQNLCQVAPIDPVAFTNTTNALFCSGATPIYQWEDSSDGTTWSAIMSATSVTYDIPAGFAIGTRYYRRRADDGLGISVYSNTISVSADSPQGDQTSYGAGSWIGYVYDGVNNYASANYHGYFAEAAVFNESFCGNTCTFPLNGCDIYTETFTVRLKMQVTLCGLYEFTIGGDDGVRLSIDGGSSYLINGYTDHGYTTYTSSAFVNGTVNLVLEYYENGGNNQVSFNYNQLAIATGGIIGSSQTLCQTTINPAAFSNTSSAIFCSNISPLYQWETSIDNASWSDVSGATSSTYDVPAGLLAGTYYYRRRAADGVSIVYSNTVTIVGTIIPGDETTYGTNAWIGYVYEGVNNFSNYQGYFNESAIFDESFCGNNCTFSLNGCGINTETFTVRLKMRITLPAAGYTFTIGADDGVRLSIDGGSTYLLNDYSNHPYRTVTSSAMNLSGTYDFVLEYFENGGDNRLVFSYSAGPLPVTWSYLNGYHENNKNIIQWKTAMEINNTGFNIERSFDGINFQTLDWVQGSGTTLTETHYSFTDSAPSYGWNYYRMKQIDLDGKFEYSNVIPVYASELEELAFYPNPAEEEIFISGVDPQLPINCLVKNGTTLHALPLYQDILQPGRFILPQLNPGVHTLHIEVGEKKYVKKIVIK